MQGQKLASYNDLGISESFGCFLNRSWSEYHGFGSESCSQPVKYACRRCMTLSDHVPIACWVRRPRRVTASISRIGTRLLHTSPNGSTCRAVQAFP